MEHVHQGHRGPNRSGPVDAERSHRERSGAVGRLEDSTLALVRSPKKFHVQWLAEGIGMNESEVAWMDGCALVRSASFFERALMLCERCYLRA